MILSPNSYDKISWGDELYRIGVIGDGNCLFHALLLATDEKYSSAENMEKIKMVSNFRQQLPAKINIIQFALFVYDDLPSGVNKYLSSAEYPFDKDKLKEDLEKLLYMKEFSNLADNKEKLSDMLTKYIAFLEYIKNQREHLGDEVSVLLSEILNLDIYITSIENGENTFVYNNPETAYKGRRSVILSHVKQHWEVIGRKTKEGMLVLFEPTDYIIARLRKHNENTWKEINKV